MSGGPLAEICVLDLTINVLGPLATQILGDMGADVIIGYTESEIAQFAKTAAAATP